MSNIHLLCGIPASGKSTFVKEEAAKLAAAGRSVAIISRDNCRKALVGEDVEKENYFSREDEVFENFVSEINKSIDLKVEEIFIDATHINQASRNKILSRIKPAGNLIVEVFPISLESAIERNNKREGFAFVPHGAMRRMSSSWSMPTLEEFSKNDKFGFNSVIIEIH